MDLEIEIKYDNALRARNRALSITNRILRRREEALVAQRDETVEALLETPNEAEEAFGELWASGYFRDCGPQDYTAMVEKLIPLLNMQMYG